MENTTNSMTFKLGSIPYDTNNHKQEYANDEHTIITNVKSAKMHTTMPFDDHKEGFFTYSSDTEVVTQYDKYLAIQMAILSEDHELFRDYIQVHGDYSNNIIDVAAVKLNTPIVYSALLDYFNTVSESMLQSYPLEETPFTTYVTAYFNSKFSANKGELYIHAVFFYTYSKSYGNLIIPYQKHLLTKTLFRSIASTNTVEINSPIMTISSLIHALKFDALKGIKINVKLMNCEQTIRILVNTIFSMHFVREGCKLTTDQYHEYMPGNVTYVRFGKNHIFESKPYFKPRVMDSITSQYYYATALALFHECPFISGEIESNLIELIMQRLDLNGIKIIFAKSKQFPYFIALPDGLYARGVICPLCGKKVKVPFRYPEKKLLLGGIVQDLLVPNVYKEDLDFYSNSKLSQMLNKFQSAFYMCTDVDYEWEWDCIYYVSNYEQRYVVKTNTNTSRTSCSVVPVSNWAPAYGLMGSTAFQQEYAAITRYDWLNPNVIANPDDLPRLYLAFTYGKQVYELADMVVKMYESLSMNMALTQLKFTDRDPTKSKDLNNALISYAQYFKNQAPRSDMHILWNFVRWANFLSTPNLRPYVANSYRAAPVVLNDQFIIQPEPDRLPHSRRANTYIVGSTYNMHFAWCSWTYYLQNRGTFNQHWRYCIAPIKGGMNQYEWLVASLFAQRNIESNIITDLMYGCRNQTDDNLPIIDNAGLPHYHALRYEPSAQHWVSLEYSALQNVTLFIEVDNVRPETAIPILPITILGLQIPHMSAALNNIADDPTSYANWPGPPVNIIDILGAIGYEEFYNAMVTTMNFMDVVDYQCLEFMFQMANTIFSQPTFQSNTWVGAGASRYRYPLVPIDDLFSPILFPESTVIDTQLGASVGVAWNPVADSVLKAGNVPTGITMRNSTGCILGTAGAEQETNVTFAGEDSFDRLMLMGGIYKKPKITDIALLIHKMISRGPWAYFALQQNCAIETHINHANFQSTFTGNTVAEYIEESTAAAFLKIRDGYFTTRVNDLFIPNINFITTGAANRRHVLPGVLFPSREYHSTIPTMWLQGNNNSKVMLSRMPLANSIRMSFSNNLESPIYDDTAMNTIRLDSLKQIDSWMNKNGRYKQGELTTLPRANTTRYIHLGLTPKVREEFLSKFNIFNAILTGLTACIEIANINEYTMPLTTISIIYRVNGDLMTTAHKPTDYTEKAILSYTYSPDFVFQKMAYWVSGIILNNGSANITLISKTTNANGTLVSYNPYHLIRQVPTVTITYVSLDDFNSHKMIGVDMSLSSNQMISDMSGLNFR